MEDFRILVSVDGSECSDRVVAMAAELARAAEAELDVLYVSYFASETDATEDSWLPDIVAAPVSEQQEAALARARALIPARQPVAFHQRTGRPAEEILRCAEEYGSRLIVMGRHDQHGLLNGFLNGSVSQEVLNESPVSVLVVK
jgi:nucleotide-binding universal stress UspA family protein